jgi:hypothetical protein
MAGISPRNLKYMRAFAAAWPDAAIVQRAVAQLPWRQNIALLERQRDPQIRLWYAAQPTSRFSDNTDRSIARLANIEICISRASQRERVQENSSTFLAAI